MVKIKKSLSLLLTLALVLGTAPSRPLPVQRIIRKNL